MTCHPMRPLAALACGALLSFAALAQSSSAYALHDMASGRHADGPRLSVYWQMPFDGTTRLRGASYGLRLDSSQIRHSMVERMPLLDLRAGQRQATLLLSGVPTFRLSESSDGKGQFESLNWDNPLVYLLTGAAVLGISCATDHWPCRKDDDAPAAYTPPPTGTPTTGGG
jgi:hypothetical protein